MISIYSKNNTDFEHNGDAVLIPTSCKLSATINGAWQLTLEHPYDPEERYKYIVEGATIVADIRFIRELSTTRQKFRIYNYVKGLHSVTAIAFPVAMESTYDAPIDNLVISGKTGAQAMAQLQTKTNKYTLSSDITRTGSTSFSNTNINSAIASGDEGCFIDVWGGDILYDNLTFSVKNKLGDNVAADHPVIYGRNLTDIEYKKDDSGLTTRIYPISQDGIRLNGTGYVDSSRISDYPVPHSKFMTAPYSLIDTNAGSSTSTATKTQQAVSGVSTEASTTSQSVYATLKGNGYQPEYIKSIRNAIVEAVQTMALASVVSTSYYNLMANTIKSAMDWMESLSQPKWEWMGSDQTGWKYGNASSYAKNMYVKIGKTWSYFGSDGNWQEPKDDSDEWDWHDAKGGTGKKYGNFTKYYAHNEYVYITVNGTIKEYWFNEQGWFEEDESGDSDYYWHGSGTGADPYWFGSSSSDYLKSCWRFIDGTYYFFDSYGYVATQKDNYQWDWNDNGDSSRAWFGNAINSEYGSDGACLKSQWQKINGTWYYFDSNGLVVDEAVSQTQTVAAFTTGMASVKTTVDSWASQLYTLLYSLMTSYANKQFASGVDLPTITITVKMADLKKTTEYADYAHLEEIKLGDSVECIDAVHDITTENRIIGITYDILRDYNESIVIGSASATVAQMVGNAGGEAVAQGFDTTAIENQLTALRNGKQDKLTAGDNITIENNIISANAGGAGESTVYYGVGAPADTLGIDGDIYVEMAPASSGCADSITYIRSSNLSTISNTYADGFHKITGQWWTDRYEHTYTTYRIDGLTAGEEYDVILKVKINNLVQEYESSSELFGIGIQNDSSWNTIANHVTNGEFAYYEDGNDKIYFQSLKPMTTKTQSYSFKFTAFSNTYILISPDAIVNDSTIPMEVEIAISDGTVGTDIVDVYYKIEDEWLRYESDASYIAGANITITEVDGEKVISATDTTYTDFEGATSSADGASGLVPAPEAGDEGKYLKGDGTWATVQGGGTTVIANPSGTATADLNKIQVDNTIYQIPQGGGGSGGVIPNPTGTPTDTLETIGFNDIIKDYYLNNGLVGASGGSYVYCNLDKNMESGLTYNVILRDGSSVYTSEFGWEGSTKTINISGFELTIQSTKAGLTYYSGAYRNIYCDIYTETTQTTIYDIEGGEQQQADWTQTDNTAVDYIKNKPTLATVATSGDYDDLTDKPSIPTKTSDLTNDSNFVSDANYVHTDNNFTTSEKTKLSGIESGAEANVQANWNETDNTSDAYIQNKPNLATVATSGAYSDLSGTPSLATVATSGSYNDLNNKPTIPTVEANPSGTASATLSTLEVDGTIYNVPSGGGSDLPLTVENGKLCIIYET